MEQITNAENEPVANIQETLKATIAIKKETMIRLDDSKSPGQCYDGFINELVEYWERYRIGSSLCGPGRPIRRYEQS